MAPLWLRVRAPFAAYRPLAAGVFRGTARTMPHSAAYGLLLNIAGIESRSDVQQPVTGRREGLPVLEVAIGDAATEGCEPPAATVGVLYQQLHGYPVGSASKALAAGTRGAKYHIAPARRELLVGLDVVVAVRPTNQEGEAVLRRLPSGLAGELDGARYGLLFAGDNNLLVDRIDLSAAALSACWYTPVHLGDAVRLGTVRLTSVIDRADSSRTTAALFAPLTRASHDVPDAAWVRTGG